MNIGDINWPKKPEEIIKTYLEFLLKVLEELDINFENYDSDPIKITKDYLDNKISQDFYIKSVDVWWGYLNDNNSLREFKNQKVLEARLAICLLGITDEHTVEIEDSLSWFFEVLQFLGYKLKVPFDMMEKHFSL